MYVHIVKNLFEYFDYMIPKLGFTGLFILELWKRSIAHEWGLLKMSGEEDFGGKK